MKILKIDKQKPKLSQNKSGFVFWLTRGYITIQAKFISHVFLSVIHTFCTIGLSNIVSISIQLQNLDGSWVVLLLFPRPWGIKGWCCLTSDVCLTSVVYIRSAGSVYGRPTGWMARIGWSGPSQGCRCALPLQAWAGHIVAAAGLQLVMYQVTKSDQCPSLAGTAIQCHVLHFLGVDNQTDVIAGVQVEHC